MSFKVRDECKLDYSKQNLTDDAVKQLRLEQDSRNVHYEDIDFSQNQLTSRGLHTVLKLCHMNPNLRILRVFKNNIDDEGAEGLANLCKALPWIEELHLSHNYITDKGIDLLVTAAVANRPERATPLWLRCEHNDIVDPNGVYREFTKRFNVCRREDEWACAVRHCKNHSKIHLPHFDKQRGTDEKGNEKGGKGSGKHKRKEKEEAPRPTVVLTARSDIDPPVNDSPREARRDEFPPKARRRRSPRDHHNGDRYLDGHDRQLALPHHGSSRHQRGSERSSRHDHVPRSLSPAQRRGDFGSPRHRGDTSGRTGGEPRRERRELREQREPRDATHRRERRAQREVAPRRERNEVGRPRPASHRDERCLSRRRRREHHTHHRERLPDQPRDRQPRSRRPRSPGRAAAREAMGRRPGVEERRPKRPRYDVCTPYSAAGPPPRNAAPRSALPALPAAPHVLPNSEVGQAWGAPAAHMPSNRQYLPPVPIVDGVAGLEGSYSSSSSFSDAEDGPPGANNPTAVGGLSAAVPGMAAPGSLVASARVPGEGDDRGAIVAPTGVAQEDDYSSPTFSDSLSDDGLQPPVSALHPVPPSHPATTTAGAAEVSEGRPRSVQRSLPSSEMSPDFAAEQPDGVDRDRSSSCEREHQWEEDRGCPPPSPSRSRSRDVNGPGGQAKTRMEALKERLTQKWQKKRTG